ncbi:MAG: tail fiber domain-containing protein [Saprospiraceae bacterium]|nr:tail fiber domain-containing protein [Saprospiraceae bacterium]
MTTSSPQLTFMYHNMLVALVVGNNQVDLRRGTLYTTTNPNVASDRKLKKDIADLDYGLNQVLRMKPIDYHLLTEKKSQKKHLGFIAQEMELIVPEVVEKQIRK